MFTISVLMLVLQSIYNLIPKALMVETKILIKYDIIWIIVGQLFSSSINNEINNNNNTNNLLKFI